MSGKPDLHVSVAYDQPLPVDTVRHKYDHLEREHPRHLIPALCRQFYGNGWVTGTGGGISVRLAAGDKKFEKVCGCAPCQKQAGAALERPFQSPRRFARARVSASRTWHTPTGAPSSSSSSVSSSSSADDAAMPSPKGTEPSSKKRKVLPLSPGGGGGAGDGKGKGKAPKYGPDDQIYIAPSGVQKERIQPGDLFVLSPAGAVVSAPHPEKGLSMSQCTPLFFTAYRLAGAGACIHTHSQHAVMATLHALQTPTPNEFRISHQEMIKGIRVGRSARRLRYDQELIVPIIDNTPHEKDLDASMAAAIKAYPETNAILVRRHGVYVWGLSWQDAKCMCECFDYLFEIAGRMRAAGLDPAAKPPQ